ncbi:MAG: DUF3300 domain-containing protein [Candidatus Omnitrophica bacterium]|nr:DUF3300 domain-containing protein [Candidatus Omnitrophota bacterium]
MIGIKLFKRITACALVFLLAVPFTAAQSSEKVFKQEELEQLLASIALYPDALLAQMLTAATYPLEVVAADRFVKENQGLKGEMLLEAAKDKDWEPSVKAMLEFPDVLAMMDEQLEWTKNLGDAFLAQQSDCMDAVQRLRQKAYAQGNLATTEKQVIRVEPQTQIIIIELASPEIVYVPVYDPAIIYGDWRYPAYPHRSYRSGQGDQPWRYDARHRTSVTVRPSAPDSRQYDQVTVISPRIDARESVRPSISGKTTVRKVVINSRENAKPSINVPRSSGKDLASKKRLPATELKRDAAETSTGDLRIKESAKPATVRDNDNIPAAKSRGMIRHAENADLQANRQFAPVSNGSNVLPEGLMRTGGR